MRSQCYAGRFTFETDAPTPWRWLPVACCGAVDLKAGEITDIELPPPATIFFESWERSEHSRQYLAMDERTLESLFVAYRDHGDAGAFATLFDRAAPPLRAVAWRLSRIRGDADDLVQATFVTAIERATTFDSKMRLMPWLIGILAHHAKNQARRTNAPIADRDDAIAHDPPPLEAMIGAEERTAVLAAIDALPEPFRSAVATRWNAKDHEAEAHAGTLRTRIHRGIALLRKLLPRESFAGGILLRGDRSLAEIRVRVLERALGSKGIAATFGATGLGAGIMMKKFAAAVVLVVIAATWIAIATRQVATSESRDDVPSIAPVIATPAQNEAQSEATNEPTTSTRDITAATHTDAALPPIGDAQGFTVRGRVIDSATGSPVANAACFVSSSAPRSFELPPNCVRTDSDGRFTISNVPRLIDFTCIVSADYAPLAQRIDWPGDTIARHEGVDVGDLRLPRGGAVRGRVVDQKGQPFPDAPLLVYDGPLYTSSFFPSRARSVGRSASDGTFELAQVPPSGAFPSRLFAITNQGSAAALLHVVPGSEHPLDVELRLAPSGPIEIEVVDPVGKPVEGVTIGAAPIVEPFVYGNLAIAAFPGDHSKEARILHLANDPHLPAPLRAVTDAAGHATILALPSDLPCAVHASKTDFIPWFADVVRLSAGKPTRLRATLLPANRFAIGGKVVDTDGRPLPGAMIERYGTYQCDVSPKIDEMTCDALGRFRFDPMKAAEEMDLCVGAPGIARQPLHVRVPDDHDLCDLVLVASAALPIAGVVVDESGKPIPDAGVMAHRGETYLSADKMFTDAEGHFTISNVTAGRWSVTAGAPGPRSDWVDKTAAIDVDAGDRNVRLVVVHDTPGRAQVEVELLDSVSRLPIDPIEVLFGPRSDSKDYVGTGREDAERERGLVRILHCKPGAWRLRVRCEGHPVAFLDIDVAPSDTLVRCQLLVAPAARVRGTITASGLSRQELRAALVHATITGGRRDRPAIVNNGDFAPGSIELNGSLEFHFDQAPSGEIFVQMSAENLIGSTRLVAQPGEESVVEIHAVRPGIVKTEGAATFGRSRLLVRLSCDDAADGWILLGSNGQDARDSSTTLAPGTYRWSLVFAKPGAAAPSDLFQLPSIAEGTIEVRAGETSKIALPAPPH